MSEINMWKMWLSTLWRTRRLHGGERGEITQTVIIVALFAAAAITISTIIIVKFTSKANTIPTN
jgi:hypothetical protein